MLHDFILPFAFVFPFSSLSLYIYIYSGLLGCKFRLRRHRLYHHQLRLVPVLSARDFAILAPSRPFSSFFSFPYLLPFSFSSEGHRKELTAGHENRL